MSLGGAPKHEDLFPLEPQAPVEVFGDASYGTADVVNTLEQAGIEPNVKVQPPFARESPLRK